MSASRGGSHLTYLTALYLPMDSTSASLLQRIRRNDAEEAWNRFVQLYSPMIYRWGLQHGLDRDASADLVQDVMAKLLVKLKDFSYQPDLRFRSWLKTVVINQARDKHRKDNREPRREILDSDPTSDPIPHSDVFEEKEYRRFLIARARDLMHNQFEPKTWEACWLYVAEGLSTKEVAQKLGISENAVRVSKCRILASLRKELQGLLD